MKYCTHTPTTFLLAHFGIGSLILQTRFSEVQAWERSGKYDAGIVSVHLCIVESSSINIIDDTNKAKNSPNL